MENQVRINWSDGAYYAGDGLDGIPDGKGIYVTADGQTFEGIWSSGFSYGVYRSWLEINLTRDNFNLISIFDAYFESVEVFIKESMMNNYRYSRNFYSILDLTTNYSAANRLKSHGNALLDDFVLLICNHFPDYSNNSFSGQRVYTCGGRYSIPADFRYKAKDLILTIDPIRNFKICFLHLDAAIDSLGAFMKSSVEQEPNSARSKIFSDVLSRFS